MRVVVTGSAGGIGGDVVARAVARGWQVVGLDVQDQPPDVANVRTVPCDVSDFRQCERAVQEATETLGGLDGVVVSAGVNLRDGFVDARLDSVRRLWDVNVWGSINILRAAHPHLVRSKTPSVVCLSSISGQLGMDRNSYYAMSKQALEALVRSLAVEWAAAGIRINAVAPAIVPTEMNAEVRKDPEYLARKLGRIPLGRMISTGEVGEAVAFLLSAHGSGVTGQVLNVDGGASVMG